MAQMNTDIFYSHRTNVLDSSDFSDFFDEQIIILIR